MIGGGPKQLARIGLFYLEEAILDILLDAMVMADENGEGNGCLGAAAISRKAGIFRDAGGGGGNVANLNDAIATGVLIKLQKEGKVERCEQPNNRGGWRLTSDELERRLP